ncbi:MAG: radical SAM protein [bacterium]
MLNQPQFRPPAEADSLILQVDQGCPYNRCTFCGMYKQVLYQRRSLAEIRKMIEAEARDAPFTNRVFLADGDVMRRSFDDLEAILREIAAHFPHLARVNVYATGTGIIAKTSDELRVLRALKLHTLYLGLESGDEETLRRVSKGETVEVMVEAGRLAQANGLKISVMILLGLGGVERTHPHAVETAMALNRMQPRLLSALRIVPVPGTELHDEIVAGRFKPLTELQVVQELRQMVQHLELTNTVFRANHTSNPIPLEARFGRDKGRLMAELDALIDSGALDSRTPGHTPLWL